MSARLKTDNMQIGRIHSWKKVIAQIITVGTANNSTCFIPYTSTCKSVLFYLTKQLG